MLRKVCGGVGTVRLWECVGIRETNSNTISGEFHQGKRETYKARGSGFPNIAMSYIRTDGHKEDWTALDGMHTPTTHLLHTQPISGQLGDSKMLSANQHCPYWMQ